MHERKKEVLINEKPLNGVTFLKETEKFMDGLGRGCHQQEDFILHHESLVYFYRLLTYNQICTIDCHMLPMWKRRKNKNQV